MKILIFGGLAESLINFRGHLLQKMVDYGHEVITCANGENLEVQSELNKMGVKYYAVNLKRTSLNPIKDFITFVKLFRLFKKIKPELVLCYTIKPVIYGSMASYCSGVKKNYSIITGLGYVFTGETFKHKIIRILVSTLYKISLKTNQNVFFQNPDDLNYFANIHLVSKDKQVLINGSGVDLDKFCYIPCSKTPAFLLIARLLKDKGIVEYVDAARILKKKYPNATFQLLGPIDSNPAAINMSQIQKWQNENVIQYLGETKDVRAVISSCNIYVLPSYREGLPRTILEAMALGRPIITTDAPGCRETVVEGENGFLVPVRNVEKLVIAMERFILKPELIDKFSKRSRQIAEEKFNVHAVNDIIIKHLGLLNEKNG